MERCYIGIDGGGTKTAAMLFDESGCVKARRMEGPCNPNVLGFEESAALVKGMVASLSSGHGRVEGIYVGTSGIFTEDDGPRFAAAVSRVCGVERVKCENDVMNVVAAATDSERCVAGVCGTGMIVYAKEPGRVTRFDGWGYRLGLGGSGYDIGRDARRGRRAFWRARAYGASRAQGGNSSGKPRSRSLPQKADVRRVVRATCVRG